MTFGDSRQSPPDTLAPRRVGLEWPSHHLESVPHFYHQAFRCHFHALSHTYRINIHSLTEDVQAFIPSHPVLGEDWIDRSMTTVIGRDRFIWNPRINHANERRNPGSVKRKKFKDSFSKVRLHRLHRTRTDIYTHLQFD